MVVPISLYIALPAFRDIPNLSVWIPVRIVHRHIWPSHTAKIVIKLWVEGCRSPNIITRKTCTVIEFQPFCDIGIDFSSHVVAAQSIFTVFQQTTLIQIIERSIISHLFRSSVHAYIMLLREYAAFKHFTVYVYVGIRIVPRIVPCIRICRIRIHSSGKFSGLKIQHLLHHLVRKNLSTSLLIFVSFIEHHGKRVWIHRFRHIDRAAYTEAVVVVYGSFPGFTTLGRDKNHTERCTWTINGGSCRIFQNRYVLNILWIDGVQVPFRAVNQYQRATTWIAAYSSCTTDRNTHVLIQLSGARTDFQTGD